MSTKNRNYRLDQVGIEGIPFVEWPSWYIESINKLKGFCLWCGKRLEDKRRVYCKPKDKWELSCKDYCRCAVHDLQVTSIRRYVHKLFNFECQNKRCGKHFSFKTPAGAELPVHSGEVHHVKALKNNGLDSIENMTLLCGKCHKKETFKSPPRRNE